MIELSEPEIRTLAASVNIFKNLYNISRTGTDREFERGLIHAGNGTIPEKEDGTYADGYAAGLVIKDATDIVKRSDLDVTIKLPKIAAKPAKKAPDDKLLTRDEKIQNARLSGFTGDVCTLCQGCKMRRSGTCLICSDCSQTTGCS